MQVKDLIVTGDAKILGNLYANGGSVSGSGGSGSSDGSGLTYQLTKSGSTITLTGSDGSTSSVTDANTDTNTTYSAATTSAAGLMSASDKSKLDGITASADAVSFTRSLTSGTKIGTITINGTGTDLYCQTNTDTTYSAATTSAAGLMSASDKSKLDGIAAGADTVSFTPSVTTGGKVGTITINGTATAMYAPTQVVVDTAIKLITARPFLVNLSNTTTGYFDGGQDMSNIGVTSTLAVWNGGTGYSSIADTTYTTARYRASALVSAETNPSINGVINWTYE